MKLLSKAESSGTGQQDSQKQAGANPQKNQRETQKKKPKGIQPRSLGTEIGFQKHEGIKHEEQHRDGVNKTDEDLNTQEANRRQVKLGLLSYQIVKAKEIQDNIIGVFIKKKKKIFTSNQIYLLLCLMCVLPLFALKL